MTIEEVLEEITSECKYYVGIMHQSSASNTVQRIRLGLAKQSTIRKFFNAFGYVGAYNEWQKKSPTE